MEPANQGPAEFGRRYGVLAGHVRALKGLTWSPGGGKLLVSWAGDKTLRIWDVDTGQAIRTFLCADGCFESAALSADRALLATGSQADGVDIWDIATHERLRTIRQPGVTVRTLAWAPAGRRVAWGAGTEVWVWDAGAGQPERYASAHQDGTVYQIAWAPDGRHLLVACARQRVQLWSAEDQRLLRTFAGHSDDVLTVAWAPSGAWFSSGSADKTICIWTPEGTRPARQIATTAGSVRGLTVSCDGALLAAQYYTFVRLWRTDTWDGVIDIPLPHAVAPALAFHPSVPLLATRGAGETIATWMFDLPVIFARVPFTPPAP